MIAKNIRAEEQSTSLAHLRQFTSETLRRIERVARESQGDPQLTTGTSAECLSYFAILPPEIIQACRRGNKPEVEEWLEKGGDKNARGEGGRTLLINAGGTGHIEIVEMLLKRDAEIDLQAYEDKTTALIAATRNGHIKIMDLLRDRGADTKLENAGGKTASQIVARADSEHERLANTVAAFVAKDERLADKVAARVAEKLSARPSERKRKRPSA